MPGFSWGFAARACHSLGIIGVPDDEEVVEHSTCLSGYAYSVAQAAQISSDSRSLDHQSCANDSPPVTFVPSRRNIRRDGDAQVTRVPQWVSLVSRLSSEDGFHGKSWRAIWTNTNAVWRGHTPILIILYCWTGNISNPLALQVPFKKFHLTRNWSSVTVWLRGLRRGF